MALPPDKEQELAEIVRLMEADGVSEDEIAATVAEFDKANTGPAIGAEGTANAADEGSGASGFFDRFGPSALVKGAYKGITEDLPNLAGNIRNSIENQEFGASDVIGMATGFTTGKQLLNDQFETATPFFEQAAGSAVKDPYGASLKTAQGLQAMVPFLGDSVPIMDEIFAPGKDPSNYDYGRALGDVANVLPWNKAAGGVKAGAGTVRRGAGRMRQGLQGAVTSGLDKTARAVQRHPTAADLAADLPLTLVDPTLGLGVGGLRRGLRAMRGDAKSGIHKWADKRLELPDDPDVRKLVDEGTVKTSEEAFDLKNHSQELADETDWVKRANEDNVPSDTLFEPELTDAQKSALESNVTLTDPLDQTAEFPFNVKNSSTNKKNFAEPPREIPPEGKPVVDPTEDQPVVSTNDDLAFDEAWQKEVAAARAEWEANDMKRVDPNNLERVKKGGKVKEDEGALDVEDPEDIPTIENPEKVGKKQLSPPKKVENPAPKEEPTDPGIEAATKATEEEIKKRPPIKLRGGNGASQMVNGEGKRGTPKTRGTGNSPREKGENPRKKGENPRKKKKDDEK